MTQVNRQVTKRPACTVASAYGKQRWHCLQTYLNIKIFDCLSCCLCPFAGTPGSPSPVRGRTLPAPALYSRYTISFFRGVSCYNGQRAGIKRWQQPERLKQQNSSEHQKHFPGSATLAGVKGGHQQHSAKDDFYLVHITEHKPAYA